MRPSRLGCAHPQQWRRPGKQTGVYQTTEVWNEAVPSRCAQRVMADGEEERQQWWCWLGNGIGAPPRQMCRPCSWEGPSAGLLKPWRTLSVWVYCSFLSRFKNMHNSLTGDSELAEWMCCVWDWRLTCPGCIPVSHPLNAGIDSPPKLK